MRTHRLAVFVRREVDRNALARPEQVVIKRAAPEIIQAFAVYLVGELQTVGLDHVKWPQRAVKRGKQPQVVLCKAQIVRGERFRLKIFVREPVISENRRHAALAPPVLIKRRRAQRDGRAGLQNALERIGRFGAQRQSQPLSLIEIARRGRGGQAGPRRRHRAHVFRRG